jgi:hypothetical protein
VTWETICRRGCPDAPSVRALASPIKKCTFS